MSIFEKFWEKTMLLVRAKLLLKGYTDRQVIVFGVGKIARDARSQTCRVPIAKCRKNYPAVVVFTHLGMDRYQYKMFEIPADTISKVKKRDDARITVKASKKSGGWQISNVPPSFVEVYV